MRRMLMVMCGLVAGPAGAAETGGQRATFDQAASLQQWAFHNGPEFPGAAGRIAWQSDAGHDRPGCLALHYSFAGGGNYVQAVWSLPGGTDATRARLWLNKPGGQRVTFRVADSAGQAFQKGVDYSFAGWQQIEVDLTHWSSFFGGPADGKVRPPIRTLGILIENTADPREGVLHIDDVELIVSRPDASRPAHATYVACDFKTPQGWWLTGGPGNGLDASRWQYTFNAGQGRPSINTDFSLLGRPLALRLVLDSDGSGHDVHVQLASHAQLFHRQVGRLTAKGEQTLEVPLGNMDTWQHAGGPNDGQVRLPLRFRQIRLEREDAGPVGGAVTLKRLEIDTDLEGRTVLLLPDVRQSGDEVVFSVRVQNLRPTEVAGQLVCDIRSLARRIDRKIVPTTLPAGGGPVHAHEFRAALGQHHFLETVSQWVEPEAVSPPVSIGTSTLLTEPGSAKLEPESPIGVGLYLYRWHGDHRRREAMTELAGLARRAGVKWIREEINWGLIEPREGQYDWTFYDEVIEIARGQGISICGLLAYWSPYAKPDTPEGIEQYCRWARQVIHRYKDKIKHWEIWNEPNIFFWSGPREMYADLLTKAYGTIKAEDPDAQVLGCSTSTIDREFIRMTMDRGGKFDALTIHPYRGVLNDVGYVRELQETKALVGGRPVWITEVGFPSQLFTGYSERRQASLAARVYLASLASGAIRNVAWYDFRNDGDDPYYNEMNFGLVRSDFRPKPGYRALATIGHALAGCRVVEQINVGAGAYAFRFTDGQQDAITACAPDNGRVLTFETDADVRIVNAVDEFLSLVRDGRRISLTLDTGFPVYISGKAGFAFKPTDAAVTLSTETATVRAGQVIELRISPDTPVSEWDLPFGWPEPEHLGSGVYRLTVPRTAPAGHTDLQAIIDPAGKLRLPLVLSVHPAIIRL